MDIDVHANALGKHADGLLELVKCQGCVMKRLLKRLLITAPSRRVLARFWPVLALTAFTSLKSARLIPHGYDTRWLFWNEVATRLKNEPVLFLEFGVWKGESVAWFSKSLANPDSRFIGFDTFTGLPEDWTERVKKGTFSTSGLLPDLKDERVSFKKGLFSESLPACLDELKSLMPGRRVIVHLDADLFSSTLFVLCTLWPVMKEYEVLFDEFFGEESLALLAFLKAYPVTFEMLFVDNAEKPNRAFGRISASSNASIT